MGKKIIVAGLGHGGIAAAAILAKAGYDVNVYEQKNEGELGYDWTDIFAPDSLAVAGIPMPDEDKYTYKENMTFYGPSERVGLKQHVPENDLEIKLERKDIYAHLINHALGCGVNITYGCKVNGPIILGSRVVGISTEKGDFFGDLIIDACGMNSPVRMNLPASFGIEKNVARHEKISIYRAFYNKECDVTDKYKVILLKDGKPGICWVATEENHTDLLIGRIEDFDMDEVLRFSDLLRQTNPSLGTEVLRGGQFVEIPTRQPLSLMIGDGYAAIGDSAFMTVPLIGSGIANCLRASRILADAVIADTDEKYNCETLWSYQYNFFKKLGSGLAPLASAKMILLDLSVEEADYLFDSGMINEDNITIGASFTSINSMEIDIMDVINKAKLVCKNTSLLKKLPKCGLNIGKAIGVCSVIPKTYSYDRVMAWKKRYEAAFRF